jgi:hypothetical protein
MADRIGIYEFLLLIKFGKKQHLEPLRNSGKIYLNHINYFSTLEDGKVRGDPLEGISRIIQPQNIMEFLFKFGGDTIPPTTIKAKELAGPITMAYHQKNYTHMFCTYAIRRPTDLYPIDRRASEFGDHFIIISPVEFGKLLQQKSNEKTTPYAGKHIRYFEKSEYNGPVTEFMKENSYKWQNEYRFAIRSPAPGPVTLTLGDLSDITSPVLPISALKELDFNAKDATERGFIWAP